MTEHIHECRICEDQVLCWNDCALDPVQERRGSASVSVGELRTCTNCEAGIALVDDLPGVDRGPLGHAAIDRVVARATRAAILVAASSPEDAPRKFAEHVDSLYDHGWSARNPEAWARHGAVMGAKAGWSGEASRGMPLIPPDCPLGSAARCYIGAWSFAAAVVMQIRLEAGQ